MNKENNKGAKEMEKLPEGWKSVRLGEAVDILSGVRPKGGAVNEGIPSLGGEHITNDGRIMFTEGNERFVPFEFYNKMKKGHAQKNDILINKDGANTGKVGILRNLIANHIAVNEHIFIIRSKTGIYQNFLFYWLFSNFGQKAIKDKITGSAQPGLASSFANKIYLKVPPLPEQTKIAEVLETVDNAIEKTDQIIEKYKRIKQGLMQELLTKGVIVESEGESESDTEGESGSYHHHPPLSPSPTYRLRDEKKDKFKNSPLGKIPEEWEVKKLGEVGEITMGQSPNSYLINKEGKGIPFLQGNAEFKEKYPEPVNWIEKPLKIAEKGSILISVRAPIGAMNLSDNDYCIGRGLSSIKVLNDSQAYIWYSLYINITNLIRIGQGSTFEAISKNDLKNFQIPLPSLPEQQLIAAILSQIDEVIEKEKKYKEKLERIKQGLMEDLLTGRVRVIGDG